MLALVTIAVGMYLARPAALRAELDRLLGRIGLYVDHVDALSFSAIAGLHVEGLRIRPRPGEVVAAPGFALLREGSAVEIADVRVAVDTWSLLRGVWRVTGVDLQHPKLDLAMTFDADADFEAREAFDGAFSLAALHTPHDLPPIAIHEADVRLELRSGDGDLAQRRWQLSGRCAWIRPESGAGGSWPTYDIRLWQSRGAVAKPHGPVKDARFQLRIALDQAGMRCAIGWLDDELLRAFAPVAARDAWDTWRCGGGVRVDDLTFDEFGPKSATITVSGLRFEFPVEAEGSARFARFQNGNAAVTWSRGEPQGRIADCVVNLSGRLNDADVTAALTLRGPLTLNEFSAADNGNNGPAPTSNPRPDAPLDAELDLRIAGLTLPTAESEPAFVTAETLPGPLRSFFRDYDPHGQLDLDIHWTRTGGDSGGVDYLATVRPRNANCTFDVFPYRVYGIDGAVVVRPTGVTFEQLQGHHGGARISCDGFMNHTGKWTGFDLHIAGRTIPLDADLHAALPDTYQTLWAETRPRGACDAYVHLARPEGTPADGPAKPNVTVDARLLGGSVTLGDRRLTMADGVVRIADGVIAIDGLHGQLREGEVTLRGALFAGGDDAGAAREPRLWIEGRDLRIQHDAPLRDGRGEVLGTLKVDARGDVQAVMRGADRTLDAHFRITEGTLSGFGSEGGWAQARGSVTLSDGQVRIHELAAESREGVLELQGLCPPTSPLAPEATVLRIKANESDIDRLLARVLPRRWIELREILALGGPGRVTAEYRTTPSPTSGKRRQSIELTIEAARMRPGPAPLDLRDVRAELSISDSGFVLHKAEARYRDNSAVRVAGGNVDADDPGWVALQVDVGDVQFSEELFRGLPDVVADLLRGISAEGRAEVRLGELAFTERTPRMWRVAGQIDLQDAAFELGASLRHCVGNVQGALRTDAAGRVGFAGEFLIGRGLINDRAVAQLSGTLARAPGDPAILVDNIEGEFCGGRIIATLRIAPDSGAYEIELQMQDLDVAQVMQLNANDARQIRSGRMDGRIFLRGVGKDTATRTGGGEIRVRQTSLLASPVTRSVVERTRATNRPLATDVEYAEVRFSWSANLITFDRVDIVSPGARLVGAGDWDLGRERIDLTLVSATSENAMRIDVLRELLNTASRELAQYRVTGPTSRPQVSVEPLTTIAEPIRRLLFLDRD